MERRKFTRFQTHDNGYAALRGNFTTVGKINDISLNGLSFKYLAKASQEEEFSRVDIFLVENKFHLRSMPCRLVYQIPDKFGKDFFMQIVRCGLHFENPTTCLMEQLNLFIENYTIGALES
jgi:hypothetical protein